jgi:hypothetical protein
MCKDNYAAIVSQITPHKYLQWRKCTLVSVTMASIGVLTGFMVRHNRIYVFLRSCDEVRRAGRT